MAGPLRDVGQLSERSSSRRVCSWLRTNAGGVLNTCKWSDEPGLALGQSRERVSNTWVTCPDDRDNPGKPGLIPYVLVSRKALEKRKLRPPHRDGPAAH